MNHRILSSDLLLNYWSVEASTPIEALRLRAKGHGEMVHQEWKTFPSADGILIPPEGLKPSQAICTAAAIAAGVFMATLSELGQIDINQAQLEEDSLEQSLLALGRNLMLHSIPRRKAASPPPPPPLPPVAPPAPPVFHEAPANASLPSLQSSILASGSISFDQQGWVVIPEGKCHPEAAMQAMASLLQGLSQRVQALEGHQHHHAPESPSCGFCGEGTSDAVTLFGEPICPSCIPTAWDSNWKANASSRATAEEFGRVAAMFPFSADHQRVVREATDAIRDETVTPPDWISPELDDLIITLGH